MKDNIRRRLVGFRLYWGVLKYRIGYWWLRFFWNSYLYPLVVRTELIIFRQAANGLASTQDFKGFGDFTKEDRYGYSRENDR